MSSTKRQSRWKHCLHRLYALILQAEITDFGLQPYRWKIFIYYGDCPARGQSPILYLPAAMQRNTGPQNELSFYKTTFSKSEAGCLHSGQIKSSGSSAPTYSYPQIRQRHTVLPLSVLPAACGFGLILFR